MSYAAQVAQQQAEQQAQQPQDSTQLEFLKKKQQRAITRFNTSEAEATNKAISEGTLASLGFIARPEIGGRVTNVAPVLFNGQYVFNQDYKEYLPDANIVKNVDVVTEASPYQKYFIGQTGWSWGSSDTSYRQVSKEEYERYPSSGRVPGATRGHAEASKYIENAPGITGYKEQELGILKPTELVPNFSGFQTFKGTGERLLSTAPETRYYAQDRGTNVPVTQMASPYTELSFQPTEKGYNAIFTYKDVKLNRMTSSGIPVYDEFQIGQNIVPIEKQEVFNKLLGGINQEATFGYKGSYVEDAAAAQKKQIYEQMARNNGLSDEAVAQRLSGIPSSTKFTGTNVFASNPYTGGQYAYGREQKAGSFSGIAARQPGYTGLISKAIQQEMVIGMTQPYASTVINVGGTNIPFTDLGISPYAAAATIKEEQAIRGLYGKKNIPKYVSQIPFNTVSQKNLSQRDKDIKLNSFININARNFSNELTTSIKNKQLKDWSQKQQVVNSFNEAGNILASKYAKPTKYNAINALKNYIPRPTNPKLKTNIDMSWNFNG